MSEAHESHHLLLLHQIRERDQRFFEDLLLHVLSLLGSADYRVCELSRQIYMRSQFQLNRRCNANLLYSSVLQRFRL